MKNKEENCIENSQEISIIIVGDNTLENLNKTIMSVQNQTFKGFEIICVVKDSKIVPFANVKIIKASKSSSSGAMKNYGIKNANGKYLLFLNSGDEIVEDALFKLYRAATRHCCDLVIPQDDTSNLKTGFYKYNINCFRNLDSKIEAKLYKKEIFKDNKILFQDKSEDETFYWMYMPFVSNLYYIDEILYAPNLYAKNKIVDFVQSVRQIHGYLKRHNIYRLCKRTFLGYIAAKINDYNDLKLQRKLIIKISLFIPEVAQLLIYDYILEWRLLKSIRNLRQNAVLWGASLFLENFLAKYKINNKYIKGIIDGNSSRIGAMIGGYKIFSPEELPKTDSKLVIMTIKNNPLVNYYRVKNCLMEYSGVELYPNIFETDFMKNPIEFAKIERTTPRKSLEQMEYHLAEHCNLSCQGCSHFSPLAEKCFPNVQHFENDMRRLAELSCGRLKRFFLLGGEPLLNPDIIDFMRISRKYFPATRISILTNAVLLNSQKQDFWEACNNSNIVICITKYPINLDFGQIEKTAQKYDVELEYYNNTAEVIKTSQRFPLDILGQQDIKESFCCCSQANTCVFLADGKLYTCPIAPNIVHFNKFFDKNIPLVDKDGIDIYKAKSMKEILEFLSKPIPFCGYCKVNGRTFGHKWGISKKDISEWL